MCVCERERWKEREDEMAMQIQGGIGEYEDVKSGEWDDGEGGSSCILCLPMFSTSSTPHNTPTPSAAFIPSASHTQAGSGCKVWHVLLLGLIALCVLGTLLVLLLVRMPDLPPVERQALVDLYHATSGSQWEEKDGWLSGNPCGGHHTPWAGIVCLEDYDRTHIQAITLEAVSQLGVFPTLPLVSFLFSLPFSSIQNGLNGTLPSSLSRLPYLTMLDLSANPDLGGTLPPSLGGLRSLEYFDFMWSTISGTLPPELGNLTRLTTFIAPSSKTLSGTIPSSLGQLVNMEKFSLTSNLLSGTLPSSFSQWSRVAEFYIPDNMLSGVLPAFVGTFEHVLVNSNEWECPLPCWCYCDGLEVDTDSCSEVRNTCGDCVDVSQLSPEANEVVTSSPSLVASLYCCYFGGNFSFTSMCDSSPTCENFANVTYILPVSSCDTCGEYCPLVA